MKLLGDIIYYGVGWGLGIGIIVGISVLILMPYL
jgi:hypothetical protein